MWPKKTRGLVINWLNTQDPSVRQQVTVPTKAENHKPITIYAKSKPELDGLEAKILQVIADRKEDQRKQREKLESLERKKQEQLKKERQRQEIEQLRNQPNNDFQLENPVSIFNAALKDQPRQQPEIKFPEWFPLKLQKKDFQNLAVACATLLECAPPELKEAMRLELVQSNDHDHWELVLKFHPVTWFDVSRKEPNLVANAIKHIKIQREQAHKRREQKKAEIPLIESREYCEYASNCKGCQKNHAQIFCDVPVARRGGAASRPCNWYAADELVIFPNLKEPPQNPTPFDDPAKQPFILMARMETTRDLLLLPNPLCRIAGWKGHYTNSQLSCMPFFWQKVFDTCTFLAEKIHEKEPAFIIDKVAMNFGLWETAMSLDHRAIDCHGHAHLDLTNEAAKYLSQVYGVLNGRTNPPNDYIEENCTELETKRLLSMRLDGLETRLDGLETKFNGLETKFDDLKTNVDDLKTNVVDLKTNVEKLTNLVLKIAENLERK
jgi:hypothetical protein